MKVVSPTLRVAAASLAVMLLGHIVPARTLAQQPAPAPRPTTTPAAGELPDTRPDFARMAREQAETDRIWRQASEGYMRMEKITYRTSRGELAIPAFVFQPLTIRGAGQHGALVWVHENIRGHLYEHY